MIPVAVVGRSFKGVVAYNIEKDHARIVTSNMAASMDPNATARDYAREFLSVARQRPNLSRNVAHFSLSPHPDDNLSTDRLVEFGEEFAKRMGFTNNQMLGAVHNDTDIEHLHLVLNRVKYDGGVVSDNNNYQRAMKVCRQMEKEYGIRVVVAMDEPDDTPRYMREPTADNHHKIIKDSIQEAIAASSNFTEFKAHLEAEGIDVSVKINAKDQLSISYKVDDYAVKGSSVGGSEKLLKQKRLVINEADKQLIREQQEALADRSTRAEERSTDATESARNEALERRDEEAAERRDDGRDSDVSAVENSGEDRLDARVSDEQVRVEDSGRDFELEGDYKSIVESFEEAFGHVEESERAAARISEHASTHRSVERATERAGKIVQTVASNLINNVAISIGEDPVQISEGHEDEDALAYFKRTEILFKKARAAAEKGFKSLVSGEAIKPAASVAIHGAMFFIAKSLGIFNKPDINAIFRDINKADNQQTDQTKQSQASDKQANESSADIADIVQQIDEKREAKRKAEIQARREAPTREEQQHLEDIKRYSDHAPEDVRKVRQFIRRVDDHYAAKLDARAKREDYADAMDMILKRDELQEFQRSYEAVQRRNKPSTPSNSNNGPDLSM